MLWKHVSPIYEAVVGLAPWHSHLNTSSLTSHVGLATNEASDVVAAESPVAGKKVILLPAVFSKSILV